MRFSVDRKSRARFLVPWLFDRARDEGAFVEADTPPMPAQAQIRFFKCVPGVRLRGGLHEKVGGMKKRKIEVDLNAALKPMSARIPKRKIVPVEPDLDLPFTRPLRCTGDFRDEITTVGTWVMGIRTDEEKGEAVESKVPVFIVVYSAEGKRGFSKVQGNEFDVGDETFVVTQPLEYEIVNTWMTPPAVKAFIESKSPDPLDVYKRVEDYYRTYVDFVPDSRRYNLMALAAIASHFYRLFSAFPRIHVRGPQESGKERASRCFAYLSFLGVFEVNPTEAVMFRLAECQATQAIDEAERFYQTGPGASEVAPQRALINTGYQEGAMVPRVLEDGRGKRAIKMFSAYAPIALASIRDLGRVTRSRFIDVLMRRTVVPDFSDRAPSEKGAEAIRDDLYMLRLIHAGKVAEMSNKLTNKEFGILNRTWELYRPLLVVARALGLPHDDLLSFIKEWEGRRKREEMSEDGVKLLKALIKKVGAEPDDESVLTVTNSDLLEAMLGLDVSDDERKRAAQRVGYIARNFGFEKTEIDKKAAYKIAKKEIKGLWASYVPKKDEGKSGGLGGLEGLMGRMKTPSKVEKSESKDQPLSHKPPKATPSGGFAGPKIEPIEGTAPNLQTIIDALGPFRGGGQVAKVKLSEMLGIPEDVLQGFLDELVKRGAIIDRGSIVGVV